MCDKSYVSSKFELIKKPVHDYQVIMEALAPFATFFDCTKNKKLMLVQSGKPVCYLVFEGRGLICRNRDNLVLTTSRAPMIVGLTSILFPLNEEYYWRPETDCIAMRLDASAARQIISDNNLWQHLATLIGYIAYRLNDHNVKLTARSGLSIICKQIYALMDEPIEVRRKVGLTNYILDRTLLSRSYVMKIVAELKAQGKIVLDDKVLIKVEGLEDNE
ncbi:helix-turn-helix domain-containing protein [Lelliottia wanjuensis]|uniref:helix-turn-helix domain-containing protein n=1 Tax=Lelliottia wanjuensis TaxID=3050585 RepID=UPI00254B54D4|nr:helix-turn-helix domain-containing protein [Lelliottia sp. V104_15]MDK9604312.1 helix-turn-helix domain-containing protein [Lelliottia sp. V104_15]